MGDLLVVPIWLLERMAMMPCRPRLALMNPMAAKAKILLHPGSALLAGTGCPLFQAQSAADIVHNDWMNVPRHIHARVVLPIRSPTRPREAPITNVTNEIVACLSGRWNVGCCMRRASASDIYVHGH